jgi:hypothetical protein
MSNLSDKLDPRKIEGKLAYTIPDAVRASGISPSALYLAIGRGDLRARKSGARTIILDSDLRSFLRSLPAFTGAGDRIQRKRPETDFTTKTAQTG